MRQGAVLEELKRKKGYTLQELYAVYSSKRLTISARRCMADAHREVTGMECSPNEYWLPQVMSEAIEAAEALGL